MMRSPGTPPPLQAAGEQASVSPVKSFTDSAILQVVVGQKRKTFFLHKALIEESAPYLTKLLKSRTKANSEGVEEAFLKDENPGGLAVLADWLYRKALPKEVNPWDTEKHGTAYFEAYALAQSFSLPDMQNHLVDAMRKNFKMGLKDGEGEGNPELLEVDTQALRMLEYAPFRRIFAREYVWLTAQDKRYCLIDMDNLAEEWENRFDSGKLRKLFGKHGCDVAEQMVLAFCQYAFNDYCRPADEKGCCYHDHKTDTSTACG